MIEGVIVTTLDRSPDDRGCVSHIMKITDSEFTEFGEVYCSSVYPGVVKGWHLHNKMTLNYVVISGLIRFVLYDDRQESSTRGVIHEIYMGDRNYVRVTVPPRVWNGFKGLGSKESFVINFTDLAHDPEEIQRCDPHGDLISYDWSDKDR